MSPTQSGRARNKGVQPSRLHTVYESRFSSCLSCIDPRTRSRTALKASCLVCGTRGYGPGPVRTRRAEQGRQRASPLAPLLRGRLDCLVELARRLAEVERLSAVAASHAPVAERAAHRGGRPSSDALRLEVDVEQHPRAVQHPEEVVRCPLPVHLCRRGVELGLHLQQLVVRRLARVPLRQPQGGRGGEREQGGGKRAGGAGGDARGRGEPRERDGGAGARVVGEELEGRGEADGRCAGGCAGGGALESRSEHPLCDPAPSRRTCQRGDGRRRQFRRVRHLCPGGEGGDEGRGRHERLRGRERRGPALLEVLQLRGEVGAGGHSRGDRVDDLLEAAQGGQRVRRHGAGRELRAKLLRLGRTQEGRGEASWTVKRRRAPSSSCFTQRKGTEGSSATIASSGARPEGRVAGGRSAPESRSKRLTRREEGLSISCAARSPAEARQQNCSCSSAPPSATSPSSAASPSSASPSPSASPLPAASRAAGRKVTLTRSGCSRLASSSSASSSPSSFSSASFAPPPAAPPLAGVAPGPSSAEAALETRCRLARRGDGEARAVPAPAASASASASARLPTMESSRWRAAVSR
mmetsp:Transcript_7293/g.23347  ORF Transcript_7293/g.23347 Transcript_7293/m.23347 type:complete len:583 (-) Transcript_7293:736-2484(-)